MKECIGFMGRLFGHKYKARFSEKFRDGKITYEFVYQLRFFKEKTYHGDVCKRCGDIVNQERA